MLLMVEKGIRSGICQAIYRYAKASKKYMKSYDVFRFKQFLWIGNALQMVLNG